VRGNLLKEFSVNGSGKKGIDIAGIPGRPVKAASAGRVVYSGSGLLGYGQLIIIKHNSKFLSAYAHNRKLIVKEGDQVEPGQKIAELGSTGTDKPMLHFEIRRLGKPVDPLKYLPKLE
jgi:lipoprotein NlpD